MGLLPWGFGSSGQMTFLQVHTVARLSRLIQTEGSPVLQARPGGFDNQLARLEVKWLEWVEHVEKMGV